MKRCPECSAEVYDATKECPECGYPFEGTQQSNPEKESTDVSKNPETSLGEGRNTEVKKCLKCGKELNNGEKFCPVCGTQVESEQMVEVRIEKKPESVEVSTKSTSDRSMGEEKEVVLEKNASGTSQMKKTIDKVKVLLGITSVGLLVFSVALANKNSQLGGIVEKYEEELGITASNSEELEEKMNTALDDYDDLSQEYEDLKAEYEEYQEKMQPYEEMELAEAKARKKAAEKEEMEEENQKIALEAVGKVWDFQNGTLVSGATRVLCDDAREKVNKLTDETKKSELMQAIEAAEATFTAQEEAAAAEEAQGYETGISYDQLARTPDEFKGKKVKFYGEVVQVMEGDDNVHVRLAVNGDYNTILYCEYDSNIVSSRVLEDDYITVYGESYGLYSYESTTGAKITIPAVVVEKIDQ